MSSDKVSQGELDARLIELVRVCHAVLTPFDPKGASQDTIPIEFVRWILTNDRITCNVSPALVEVMTQAVKLSDADVSTTNKGAYVAPIYFFPKPAGTYPPWIPIECDLQQVRDIFSPLVTANWFPEFNEKSKTLMLKSNADDETCLNVKTALANLCGCKPMPKSDLHITIHHNVCETKTSTDGGITLVDFLDNFHPVRDMKVVGISRTTSLGWEKFHSVFVVNIESEEIQNFIDLYNAMFEVDISPSLHVSFGGNPRTVYPPLADLQIA